MLKFLPCTGNFPQQKPVNINSITPEKPCSKPVNKWHKLLVIKSTGGLVGTETVIMNLLLMLKKLRKGRHVQ